MNKTFLLFVLPVNFTAALSSLDVALKGGRQCDFAFAIVGFILVGVCLGIAVAEFERQP